MRGDLADGRVRLAGPEAKRRRRAELTTIIESHLNTYPQSWFSAVELARVIRRHLGEPVPVSHGPCHYGRSNVIGSILRELLADGRVLCRPNPDRRASWQWAKS